MQNPFKVGDRVRRKHGVHQGMKVGDTAKVIFVIGGLVHLDAYGGSHSTNNLELVQTVTLDTSVPTRVPMLLSTDAQERKDTPITSGVLDYFPRALAAVAKCSKAGNDQHNPGQPLHWAKGKSTDHADCIARHLIDRKSLDTDGIPHLWKLAWRALALLETELEKEAANVV